MRTFLILLFLSFSINAEEWRFSEKKENFSQFSRENNANFWALFQKNDSPYLKYQGLVLGDAHLGNFSVRNWEGRQELRFDDFDDIGVGPFFVDFARFMATSESFHITNSNSLIDAYIKGLKGESLQDEALKITPPQSEESLDRNELVSIKREEWNKIENAIGLSITDAASYTAKDGGSQGLTRYRVIADGKLLELKPLIAPAPSYLEIQPSDEERVRLAKEIIWNHNAAIYPRVVTIDNKNYLLRERNPKLSSNREIRNSKNAVKIANYIGLAHGKQESARPYLEEIEKDQNRFVSELKSSVNAENKQMKVMMKETIAKNSPIRIGGSVRYRLQNQKEGDNDSKMQHKFRVRLDAEAKRSNGFRGLIRLETNQSSLSGHENLDDAFEKKDIFISQAFIEKSFQNSFTVQIGKMPSPFIAVGDSEIIWDESINPEGVSLKYKWNSVFVNLGTYLLLNNYDSDKGIDLDDNKIYGAQLGIDHKFYDTRFILGIGSTKVTGLKSEKFNTIGKKSGHGNTNGGKNTFAHNYHMQDAFLDIKHSFSLIDVSLFTHFVRNHDVDKDRNAYRYGIALKRKPFELLYAFTKLEKDATLGAITNSSPADGGTNLSYHEAILSYEMTSDIDLKLTHFWAESPLDDPIKYKKFRFDITLSF